MRKNQNSLFITSSSTQAGNLITTIGVMEYLVRKIHKVAFFRPIIPTEDLPNNDITLIKQRFGIDIAYEDMYAYDVEELKTLISQDRIDMIQEHIIAKYQALLEEYDFVLCEGIAVDELDLNIEFDINLFIAKNLSTPILNVIKGKNLKPKYIKELIKIEHSSIKHEGCTHAATIVNRLDTKLLDTLSSDKTLDSNIYFLPEIEDLKLPNINQIVKTTDIDVVLAREEDLRKVVRNYKIAAMKLEHFIDHMEDGDLVIVPGDRIDIIIGALSLSLSKTQHHISAILLTGSFKLSDTIVDIIKGVTDFHVPILSTTKDTYQATMLLHSMNSTIRPNDDKKIALVMGMFEKYIDMSAVTKRLSIVRSLVVTPKMFEYALFKRAKSNIQTIVLPESSDERILKAAEIITKRQVAKIILLGEQESVEHLASSLGVDIGKMTIIDPCKSKLREKLAKELYELRKHKGITEQRSLDLLENYNTFGTMLVQCGYANGMVSGAIHTTGETIRPALQLIKTSAETSLVSSVFLMCLDTKVLVYGDCAINPDPNAEQLAQIAISSASTAVSFGIEPKIAMLSYSTGGSGSGADVDKVREATKIVQKLAPNLAIEGPIQYDAAIDMSVAKQKLPNSKVAGQANVFIFPDLNTGNNTYKAVQRSAQDSLAIGPILQGLNKPVNDLSRGCNVKDIINTIAITAIQSQNQEEK